MDCTALVGTLPVRWTALLWPGSELSNGAEANVHRVGCRDVCVVREEKERHKKDQSA